MKVLRAKVGANLAVAANLEVIWQMHPFTDERNASVEPGGLQLVWCHVIAIANLAVFADNDLFIQDCTVNYTARTNDRIKEHDRVTDDSILLNNDTWRENAALNMAFDDTAMRDQATDNLRSTANMSWGAFFATRVNHPRGIIEIEGRMVAKQFHMSIPVGLDGAYILPVAGKGIGVDALASRQHGGNNIATKVVLGWRNAGFSSASVLDEDMGKGFTAEDINAHRAQCSTRLSRFLFKRVYAPFSVCFQDAKAGTFLKRYNNCTQSSIGAALLMERDHRPVVHTIDMVASKDEHIVIVRFHNEVQILVDSVGRTLIPFRILTPSIGLKQAHAALLSIQVPGFANPNMIVQRMGAILSQNSDIRNTRVDAVAQGKINDTVFAGEGDCGFGALLREQTQALALATG